MFAGLPRTRPTKPITPMQPSNIPIMRAKQAPRTDLISLTSELVRTSCVIGPARHIKRTVPSLFRHGFAPTALSVTPSTNHSAIGSTLSARLHAQDAADSLRAKLSLYPSAKGMQPILSMAPESVHKSDEVRYVFIAGPTWWRKELGTTCLLGGKDVVVGPPCTAAEAAELGRISVDEQGCAILYDELRWAPSMSTLREVLEPVGAGGEGVLGAASKLHYSLTLATPLCCSDGHPTAEERSALKGW